MAKEGEGREAAEGLVQIRPGKWVMFMEASKNSVLHKQMYLKVSNCNNYIVVDVYISVYGNGLPIFDIFTLCVFTAIV